MCVGVCVCEKGCVCRCMCACVEESTCVCGGVCVKELCSYLVVCVNTSNMCVRVWVCVGMWIVGSRVEWGDERREWCGECFSPMG